MKLEILCAIRNVVTLFFFGWLADRFDKWWIACLAFLVWCWVEPRKKDEDK